MKDQMNGVKTPYVRAELRKLGTLVNATLGKNSGNVDGNMAHSQP